MRDKAFWRARYAGEQNRNSDLRRMYGNYFNYNTHKLNHGKRFRLEEDRNTEIERSNRILLEKIQHIFKRSNIRSQHHYNQEGSEKYVPRKRMST